MGGFPVVFIGYKLENNALDAYYLHSNPTKALLHDVESLTHNPASFVRYEDNDGYTHRFVCCFVDLREGATSTRELDAIPIPAEFSRVPEQVKTNGELRRVFAPKAMVFSYGRDGRTRVNRDAVIG